MEGQAPKNRNVSMAPGNTALQTCVVSTFLNFSLLGCLGSYFINRYYKPKGPNEQLIRMKKLFLTSLPLLFTLNCMQTVVLLRCRKYIPEEEIRKIEARYQRLQQPQNQKQYPEFGKGKIQPIFEETSSYQDEQIIPNEVDFTLTQEEPSISSPLWDNQDGQQHQEEEQPPKYNRPTKLKSLPSEMLYYTQRSNYEENTDDF